ncbi:MAG: ATP-binding protein [Roseiflexus sp.]|nr:ATP-binding protein [Roseiflexus sp.]MCS7287728.1 ATP-binding protein [Roseiflexus sp.]MDW8147927.1 histidine kinase N-terminal 7TM domain-containing protein [Roseiflexaceae bacterium]MDW8231962.1 histidine kinase N-terminal 7TM domain-containing protein [Roseiflexaceae bacterium]
MNVTLTPYNGVLLTLSIVALSVAGYAWHKRALPGALPLSLLAFALFVWLIGYAMELSSQTLPVVMWWVRLEFVGIVTAPVAWLWFAAEYTSSWSWLNRRRIWLLGVVPLITIIVILTNEFHHQFWQSIALMTDGPFTIFDSRRGFWFWVHTGYSYVCLLCGTYLIVNFIRRTPSLFRRQTGALLLAVAAPWIGNVIYLAGLSPWGKLDLTPFTFTASLIAVAWSVLGFRMLEIRPLARDMVLQSMSDGVIAVDEQGRIIEVNRAAQAVIGLPSAQIIGRHAREALARWPAIVDRYRHVTEIAEEIEVEIDATRRWFDVRISPIYDGRRVYRGRLFVWRDVTEERLIREELRRNNERLLEAQQALIEARNAAEAGSRAKSAFLAHMSHEIRTPLTAIIGYCQLLENGIERQSLEQTRHDVEAIHLAASHLLDLVSNVLEMARIETGQSDVHYVMFDASSIVRDVAMTVQPLLRRNRNRLRLEGIEELGELWGDPTKVRQILLNLVSNAAKFTTDGEVVVRVAHISDKSQPRIQFQVSDTGPGIASEHITRLFIPFAIAEHHVGREQRGAGLGLAISRHYCRLMGGELTIESAPGCGTTATFWLPAPTLQIALAEVEG